MRSSPYHRAIRLLLITGLIYGLLAGFLSPAPARADFGTWTSSGPNTKIVSIAIDPKNEQIVYAAGEGGLWKTTNAGGSWSLINKTPFYRVVVDPHNTMILYGILYANHPVYKSTDGGISWNPIYTIVNNIPVYANDVIVDPNKSNTVYVAHMSIFLPQHNMYSILSRSQDGGITWSAIYEASFYTEGDLAGWRMAMVPHMPDVMYFTITGYHSGTIVKTLNASAVPTPTWNGVPVPAFELSNPDWVALAGSQSNRVLYSSFSVVGVYEVFRSDNDHSAIKLNDTLPFSSTTNIASLHLIALNPDQPDWVYGNFGSTIAASPDRGKTWTEMGRLDQPVYDLQIAVHSHTLYAATDHGVYQFTIQWPVASLFANFYNSHQGLRLLGNAISAETVIDNKYPAQYFEKGRIEDHQGESSDPNWRFMYGLLVDELQQAKVKLPIGGDTSTLTYADLNALADPSKRIALACPGSCPDGTWVQDTSAGTVFVPFSADLKFAPGHLVLGGFWNYINRKDLFPGGWLHDVGLPITEPQVITVTKNFATGPVQRQIIVQAFQRTILTYDPVNPPDWQIERANVGTDYRKAFPDRVGP